MDTVNESLRPLLAELEKLHHRLELSRTVTPDYFEPGLMEYLDRSDGSYDPATGAVELRFEARGTRYEGRTERLERVKTGDAIQVVRDAANPFNANNFALLGARGQNLGNMPAELCNAIAPLYDAGVLLLREASVSYVEPISVRSRHARQGVLFVDLKAAVPAEPSAAPEAERNLTLISGDPDALPL